MKAVTKKTQRGDHETTWLYFDWHDRYLGCIRKIDDDRDTTHPYQVFVIDHSRVRVVDKAHPVTEGMTLPVEVFWPEYSAMRERVLAHKEAQIYLLETHVDEEVMVMSC